MMSEKLSIKKEQRKSFLTKTLCTFMACVLLIVTCFVGASKERAFAETMTYPMRTGVDNFAYGTQVKLDTQSTDVNDVQTTVYNFDASPVAMSSSGYVAVQMQSVKSQVGFNFYVASGAGATYTRYQTTGESDGQIVYFVTEDGTINEISILYGGITFPASCVNQAGVMIIPLSVLKALEPAKTFDWNAITSAGVAIGSYYNWNFEVKFGEFGYYAGDYKTTAMAKLISLNSTADNAKIQFYPGSNPGTATLIASTTSGGEGSSTPSASALKTGDVISYPMRTGENNFAYGALWSNVTQISDPALCWETLYCQFDGELKDNYYLALQMHQIGSNRGQFTIFIEGLNAQGQTVRVQTAGGTPTVPSGQAYFVSESGNVTAMPIYYDALIMPDAMIDTAGMVIVPISLMAKASWCPYELDEHFWSNIKAVGLCVNASVNYGISYKIGEIGYYDSDPATNQMKNKLFYLVAKSDYNNFLYPRLNSGTITMIPYIKADTSEEEYTPDTQILGCERILSFDSLNQSNLSSYRFDENGATGVLGTTTDTYGDTAMTLTADKEGGDHYTVPYIVENASYNWSGAKGVCFWAKNLSNKEARFNFEFDVRKNGETDMAKRTRFNLRQGVRFYMFDVNKGTESIVQTKPTISLPKGFEGWIFVPFSSFSIPDWSTKFGGPTALEFDKIYIYQIGISIDQRLDLNRTIAFNKIGVYKDIISISSAYNQSVNGIQVMYSNYFNQ